MNLLPFEKDNVLRLLAGERWAKVPGLDGYIVTASGDIYSYRPSNMHRKPRPLQKLKPATDRWGYQVMALVNGAGRKNVKIHRLVLEAFVGPPAEKDEARHLNGNPADNRLENLAWGTSADNKRDQARHGTRVAGEESHFSKLTEAQAIEALRRSRRGESHAAIARDFGVIPETISRIASGRTWKHVFASTFRPVKKPNSKETAK